MSSRASQLALVEPTWHCRGIRDTGFIQGSRRSPGGGNGSPLQYFRLKNPKDRGAWEPGRLQSMGLQRVRCNWNYKIVRLKRYALETRLCSTGLRSCSWGHEEKGMTEDEIVGWHHQFNGHEFEQTVGDGEGQGKPGMLQSMGSQRVGHDLLTEHIILI